AELTTTLTVTNSNQSSSALTYYSPEHPLRVVDYMRPEELDSAAGVVVTTGASDWECTFDRNATPLPAGVPADRNTRVVCVTTNTEPRTLAKGDSVEVAFKTVIAAMASTDAPVELLNDACTGSVALDLLGLTAANGPQPAYNSDPTLPQESTGSVCKQAGEGLYATPVGADTDTASVTRKKETSIDRTNWFDLSTDAPELADSANTLY